MFIYKIIKTDLWERCISSRCLVYLPEVVGFVVCLKRMGTGLHFEVTDMLSQEDGLTGDGEVLGMTENGLL